MKKVTYLLPVLIAATLITASCKKGDVGPQGEKGDTGSAGTKGATGADGADGVKGATGTANVIYSDWINAKNFRDTIADNSKLKIADLLAPKLTTAILNSGTTMVYFDYGTGVFAMPYTSNAGGISNTMSYLPRVGHFILTRYASDNSGSISIGSSLLFRYVIIPGGVKTATIKQNKLDINNYEAVKAYYHITN